MTLDRPSQSSPARRFNTQMQLSREPGALREQIVSPGRKATIRSVGCALQFRDCFSELTGGKRPAWGSPPVVRLKIGSIARACRLDGRPVSTELDDWRAVVSRDIVWLLMRVRGPESDHESKLAAEIAREGSIQFVRLRGLPGVEVMDVRHVSRKWAYFHETYSLCVASWVANPRDIPWRYRQRTHQ